jgi:hypothetical protein
MWTMKIITTTLLLLKLSVNSFSAVQYSSADKVLVTGASGRTGLLVFERLFDQDQFQPIALVRNEKSAKKLTKQCPKTGPNDIVICDVTSLQEDSNIPSGLDGCESMIICTSAVPTVSKVSIVKAFLKIPLNIIRGKKALDFRSLKFVWKAGQYPELVDYKGQVRVVCGAFVLCVLSCFMITYQMDFFFSR